MTEKQKTILNNITTKHLNQNSMKKILTDPAVKHLIKQFDLETPKMFNILIDDYSLVDGKIVINSAKVLSEEMEFLRFADLSKMFPYMETCNVIFNAGIENTVKAN